MAKKKAKPQKPKMPMKGMPMKKDMPMKGMGGRARPGSY